MKLDAQTLYVVLISAYLLLGIAMLYTFCRPFEDGENVWTASLFVGVAALVLLVTRNTLPYLFSVVLANVLISAQYTLQYLALSRYFKQRPSAKWLYAPGLMAAIAFSVLPTTAEAGHILASGLIVGIQHIPMFLLVWAERKVPEKPARHLLLLAITLNGGRFFFRAVAAFISPESTPSIFGPIHAATLLLAPSYIILATFAMVVMYRDRIEARLRASRQLIQSIIEGTSDSIFVKDEKGRYRLLNKAGSRFMGVRQDQILGRDDTNIFSPEAASLIMASDQAVMISREVVTTEDLIEPTHGERRIVQVVRGPVADEVGGVSGVFGIARDITAHKHAELALQSSEEKYRALIETTGTGYLILDTQGRVLDANQAYVHLTGHNDLQDILGRSVIEWTASNQREKNAVAVAQCAREGFIRDFVIDYVDGNGRATPIEVNATVVGEGESRRIIALCRDITERKQSEELLREREAQYRVLIDKAPDAIVLFDMDANLFVDCNPAAEKLFGCSREELLKTGPEQYYPLEQFDGGAAREFILNTSMSVIEGAEVKLERAIHTAQGKDLICELQIAYMPSKGRRLIRGNYVDITERKQAEAELIAAKTDAETASLTKSRFLAAASHDLRQPMQAIGLFNEALARTSLNGEQKRINDYLSQSIQSMDDLLTALLDISKFDAGAVEVFPEATPVEALVRKINAEYSPLAAGKALRFKLCFPFRDMAIMTDGKLLMSLLGNLIGNAIKYTQQGGVLVSIRRRGTQALIQVWDTGIGIPAEHLDAIYEEYFQVGNPERDRTKGLGLGLAITRRIAKLLDTTVVCRSRPGKGSVFELRLPLASGEERGAPNRIDPPSVGDHAKLCDRRVVLVEDDVMVATAMILTLEACGVTVTRYKTAEEALADPSITEADFYVSDLRLPGLSGVEFLDAIQRRATKPIQAVVVTGDTAIDRIEMMRSTSWRVLFKPVELSSLLSAIGLQDSVG